MRIVVDATTCEANGLCAAIAPAIFELNDDDELTVLEDQPDESWRAQVLEAARQCPKQAITVIEDR